MRERNWQTVRLGDVADVQSGGTPQVTVSQYWGGNIPWYSSGELNTTFTNESNKYITKSGLENSNAKLFPKGSLLIGMYDTAALKMSILDRNAAFNQAICGIKPSKHIDLLFVLQAITLNRDYILCQRRGVRQKNLNLTKIKDIQIPLPPHPEQQRIVANINEAIEGIAQAKSNTEQNLKNARELFESHLQAVFSQRGEGWVEERIGDHIRFIDYRGKTPTKTQEGVRLITAKNIKMGYLQEYPKEYVAPESYSSWMIRGVPRKGDILFTTEAPLANIAQLDTDERVVFAQRVIIMQPEATIIDSSFLKYLLMSKPVQAKIHMLGTGATVKGIKASLLKSILVSFPEKLSEQKNIVSVFDKLLRKTQRLESIYQRKIAALDELKKSLLHKAFSGEL